MLQENSKACLFLRQSLPLVAPFPGPPMQSCTPTIVFSWRLTLKSYLELRALALARARTLWIPAEICDATPQHDFQTLFSIGRDGACHWCDAVVSARGFIKITAQPIPTPTSLTPSKLCCFEFDVAPILMPSPSSPPCRPRGFFSRCTLACMRACVCGRENERTGGLGVALPQLAC